VAASIARAPDIVQCDIGSLPGHIREHVTVDPASGCWRAVGLPHNGDGYAHIKREGVHRWSWRYFAGVIPAGLDIDHVEAWGCRHRDCLNPGHLQPTPHRVNVLRGRSFAAINARKTRCGACGTPYDEQNTYHRPGAGGRTCRACNRRAVAKYRRRLRASYARAA
jgi:hypothetical protein